MKTRQTWTGLRKTIHVVCTKYTKWHRYVSAKRASHLTNMQPALTQIVNERMRRHSRFTRHVCGQPPHTTSIPKNMMHMFSIHSVDNIFRVTEFYIRFTSHQQVGLNIQKTRETPPWSPLITLHGWSGLRTFFLLNNEELSSIRTYPYRDTIL